MEKFRPNNNLQFSIICVYNDENILRTNLIMSINENGDIPYELILINNKNGRFKSAAEAYNYAGKKAKGKYILFIHQDVQIKEKFSKLEELLGSIKNIGAAGPIGMSSEGSYYGERLRGYINDRGNLLGKPLQKPEIVQTLDDLFVVICRDVYKKLKFDEVTLNSWHFYVIDYCISVKRFLDLDVYAIPFFVFHNSKGINKKGLTRSQIRFSLKHRRYKKVIFSTYATVRTELYIIFLVALARLFFQTIFNLPIPRYIKNFLDL
jgi:hypothetical protein